MNRFTRVAWQVDGPDPEVQATSGVSDFLVRTGVALSQQDQNRAFQSVISSLAHEPGVTEGTGFGSNPGLRFDGRIFAMFVDQQFVLKLPASRVQELVSDSVGAPFLNSRKIPLREWVTIMASTPERDWPDLAREALEFSHSVRSRKSG